MCNPLCGIRSDARRKSHFPLHGVLVWLWGFGLVVTTELWQCCFCRLNQAGKKSTLVSWGGGGGRVGVGEGGGV